MDSPQLTPTKSNILHYLYRFRFITSKQLRNFLNHNTIRATNHHLNNLISADLVGRHYNRKLGLGNLPAVYYLRPSSISHLKTINGTSERALKRIYKEKIRSQRFIDYSAFLIEYFLYLKNASDKKGNSLNFYTKTDLMNHPYFIHPLPDAYFSITDKNKKTTRFFVEVINDSSPRYSLRNRITQYSEYFEEERFEQATGYQTPTLLLICPNVAILMYLSKHIERVYDDTYLDQTSVYLSTREGVFKEDWQKATADNY